MKEYERMIVRKRKRKKNNNGRLEKEKKRKDRKNSFHDNVNGFISVPLQKHPISNVFVFPLPTL